MRRVAQIIGMPISVDIPKCYKEAIFDDVFELFSRVDARFSPYKKRSELSRYNRGKIAKDQLSPEMQLVIKTCKEWQKRTNGYFSAWYDDKFDPSGYVKGWALKQAGDLIKKLGHRTFCIGAGGDILASSEGKKIWKIGIQDPKNRSKILDMLSISTGAIATSGSYERGQHIVNPKTGKPAKELLSVSVIGPDIIVADVLATAAFAMGEAGVDFVNKQKGYRALAIAREVIGLNLSSS